MTYVDWMIIIVLLFINNVIMKGVLKKDSDSYLRILLGLTVLHNKIKKLEIQISHIIEKDKHD